MSGFWKTGTSGFGSSSVSGRSLVPSPAPRTNACLIRAMALQIPNGRGNGLARQRFAMEKLRLFRFPTFVRCRHRNVFHLCTAEFASAAEGVWSVHVGDAWLAYLYRRQALSPY